MSIEGQGHFLTLAQGHLHLKIKTGFSQKWLGHFEPNLILCLAQISGERFTRTIGPLVYSFHRLVTWWPRKLGQGHHNLTNSLLCHIYTIYQFWSDSIILFKRWPAETKFCTFQKVAVTLKIRMRSPKSNQLFLLFQQCICASLLKICPLVQKIMSKIIINVDAVNTNKISSKTNVPNPCGWGDINTWLYSIINKKKEIAL